VLVHRLLPHLAGTPPGGRSRRYGGGQVLECAIRAEHPPAEILSRRVHRPPIGHRCRHEDQGSARRTRTGSAQAEDLGDEPSALLVRPDHSGSCAHAALTGGHRIGGRRPASSPPPRCSRTPKSLNRRRPDLVMLLDVQHELDLGTRDLEPQTPHQHPLRSPQRP
jgi:hypothetical protein